METIFVFTHAVMTICVIGIISMSISSASRNNQEMKRSVISKLALKVKPTHVSTASLYRIAEYFQTIANLSVNTASGISHVKRNNKA